MQVINDVEDGKNDDLVCFNGTRWKTYIEERGIKRKILGQTHE